MEHMLALQAFNTIQNRIQHIKSLMIDTCDAYCETGLYFLTFHLFAHVIEELSRFRCLELPGSSLYERFKVHIK